MGYVCKDFQYYVWGAFHIFCNVMYMYTTKVLSRSVEPPCCVVFTVKSDVYQTLRDVSRSTSRSLYCFSSACHFFVVFKCLIFFQTEGLRLINYFVSSTAHRKVETPRSNLWISCTCSVICTNACSVYFTLGYLFF